MLEQLKNYYYQFSQEAEESDLIISVRYPEFGIIKSVLGLIYGLDGNKRLFSTRGPEPGGGPSEDSAACAASRCGDGRGDQAMRE